MPSTLTALPGAHCYVTLPPFVPRVYSRVYRIEARGGDTCHVSYAGCPLARLRAGDSILATPRRGRWHIRALAGAPALFSNPSGSPKRPAATLPRGLPARRSRRALRAQRGRSRTP